MPSNIDATQPPANNPTTAAMRANMAAAKAEIEALQLLTNRRACLVKLPSPALTPVTIPAGGSMYIPWASAVATVGSAVDIWTVGDPTKLYVPVGYNRARFSYCMEIAPTSSIAGTDTYVLTVTHKGGGIYDGYAWDTGIIPTASTLRQRAVSTPVVVVAGNYFRVQLQSQSDQIEKLYDDNYAHWALLELWNV